MMTAQPKYWSSLDRAMASSIFSFEIAGNSVESQRPSTLIGYATAAPFAIGFLETAMAMEATSSGIIRTAADRQIPLAGILAGELGLKFAEGLWKRRARHDPTLPLAAC